MISGLITLRTDFTDYLTVRRLSLLNGFIFVSVFFRFHFFRFHFLNCFHLQLFLFRYSYLLLSTPLLVCFLVNQSHSIVFFSFSFS